MDPGPLPAALGPGDGYARPFAHRNTGSLVPAASPACRSAVSPPQSQPLYDSNGQRSPELKYPPLSARCLPMENRRNGELGICATMTGARRPDRDANAGENNHYWLNRYTSSAPFNIPCCAKPPVNAGVFAVRGKSLACGIPSAKGQSTLKRPA
jgi:hypothetical protein